jgi:hypothetical protein
MTLLCSVPPPQTTLFNHSQLQDLKLKNLAIYPSNFTTQGVSLNWANVNFQPIAESGKRVWQFQGSGTTDGNNAEIIFITGTPYNIKFEGPVSGIITSSSSSEALNAYQITSIQSSTGNNQTIIKISIHADKPLSNFGFNIMQKDNQCNPNCLSGNFPTAPQDCGTDCIPQGEYNKGNGTTTWTCVTGCKNTGFFS